MAPEIARRRKRNVLRSAARASWVGGMVKLSALVK
jgi:hypothetical protein